MINWFELSLGVTMLVAGLAASAPIAVTIAYLFQGVV